MGYFLLHKELQQMAQTNNGIGGNVYTTGMPATKQVSTNVLINNFVLRQETAGYDGYVVINNGVCRLLGMTAYNSSGSARAIQVHDTNVQPATSATPVNMLVVPAGSQASLTLGETQFQRVYTGLAIASSSTIPTYTATGSPDVWLFVEWIAL